MGSGIRVIVCCYNSAQRISPTLQFLYSQKHIPLAFWEIIVVNDCSTDNTAEVANSIWNNFNHDKPQFESVNEFTPGLSAARKKGFDESSFKYVLFCDEDNWLNEDYLSLALASMQKSANIGALGGRGFPIFEAKETPYFWLNQYHTLAVGSGNKPNIADKDFFTNCHHPIRIFFASTFRIKKADLLTSSLLGSNFRLKSQVA